MVSQAGPCLILGDVEIYSLCDGTIKVDGGAMFGVVPRALWARLAPPDADNRVSLALNCYLARTPGRIILVDTGMGGAIGRKYLDFYGFERGEGGLTGRLRTLGLGPGDIDVVVNSHLHFDHCGGNTIRDAAGRLIPAFPNAEYVVQRGEWENAMHPVERDKPSYRPDLLAPLRDSGVVRLIEGRTDIAPGVEAVPVPGHTAHHQGLKIVSGGSTFFHPADAVPTAAHVGLAYIMSFDLYPVETFAAKKELLQLAAAEGWILAFGHDPERPFGRIRRERGGFAAVPL